MDSTADPPENETSASELTSQYITRVTSDLDLNVKEQERLQGEVESLRKQLASLQHDHTVLVNMRNVLGSTGLPAESTPAPEGAAPPSPLPSASFPAIRQRWPGSTDEYGNDYETYAVGLQSTARRLSADGAVRVRLVTGTLADY
ncbi:hypothetical protein [Streptomyces acidiscabies]|uniref:Uncharacterized protein n=1 Tax=Streptomyces acidiscabies TaxID=42234 RepID=A0ABU4MDP3_9ACTN|nr:hypothetical protein [Streptomyces acidiscabies]MDX3025632.1 hypothetical protein [Streptomyces acidiscabies]